jgi:DNA-binding XRE family transcriptional regulator
MVKSWQWDVKRTNEEIRRILKNPKHPNFFYYAALLLIRTNVPREVFDHYLKKEDFCVEWHSIKRRMKKDRLSHDRIQFWEEIYRHVKEGLRDQGVKFRKPANRVTGNSLRAQVGKRIHQIRQSKKMTQAELAQEAGLTQQFLSKIERGTENISLDTLERIQKSLKEHFFGALSMKPTERLP